MLFDSNGMSNVIFPVKFSTKCLAIHGTHLGTGCATVIEYVGTRTNIGATLCTLDESKREIKPTLSF
ncbi:MAG: hypothetical protein ON057_001483 [Glomeribacter sp. 1016415]|nr:hypothetical protein [Glomeribacter sp. 1016415]